MKKIINPWKDTEGYYCFGCAPQNESGLQMEFYEEGDEIISFWQPEAKYQGWFNTLHGGIQATLLDEICGWVIIRKLQTAGVTSKMETRYMKPIYTTGGKLTLRASIREQKRNIFIIDACICNPGYLQQRKYGVHRIHHSGSLHGCFFKLHRFCSSPVLEN